jgi:hypothetical protein
MTDLIEFAKTFLKLTESQTITICDPDSSTDKKFSKHCIIKIKNGYFRNNYHCGSFMRQFQKYIITKYGDPSVGALNQNPYYIHSKTFLLDLGVYTLRRQFRLLGSSKRINPRRPLYLNGLCDFTKQQFFDCLIQYVPDDTSNIKNIFYVPETDGTEPSSCSLRTFDNNGNTVSISGDAPLKAFGNTVVVQRTPSQPISNSEKSNGKGSLPYSLQQTLKNYFKQLYDYDITNYHVGTDKIKLECNDTRCLNKLKVSKIENHKSNHVYFVIFPETKFHFQGCYDEDTCKVGNKPSITPLGENGYIIDKKVIDELNLWWFPKDFSWGAI